MSAEAPLEDRPFSVEITERDLLHKGRVWDLVSETFLYSDKPIVRELLDHPGAVAVLAMDDDENILLIQQYRHPVRARTWEIPAGLLDVEGEPALAAAKRELAEEADLAAEQWHLLAEFYTSPGGSDEAIRIFLARDLSELDRFDRVDEEADIELRWVSLDEALTAVLEHRVQNPSTVIAVLSATVQRDRGWPSLGDPDAPWPRHPKLGSGTW